MRRLALTASIVVATFVSSVVPRTSLAIVEQIDGRVMPLFAPATCPSNGSATSCVQVALNTGEGLPATSTTNPLNSVFDAQTSPEVFAIPRTANVYGNVVVRDLVEGAGYENTFGWYNVDNPTQLYVITPCADEPGSQRTVNFQTEFVAGRYLGGFVGFFLVSPEDAPVANNCGSPTNVGHLYYTEAAKNGDGNYVHYLIYSSKVDSRRFYFGFEDLFRGGDNDFEDMFLQVDGLVLPCVPSSEVCDGLDNNCDGLVDNNPVDAGDQCGATDVGECRYGVEQCIGIFVCIGAQGPVTEICDGLDNDCNGLTDDNPFGQGFPCGTDVGECSFGQQACVGGVFVCVGGQGPVLEVCNTFDDDCNGASDDNPIDAGGPCGTNVGECIPGLFTCTGGVVGCVGAMGPFVEICDSLDNDCNGAIDDGDPGGGAMCGIDEGTCKSGVEHCLGGAIECVGAIGPIDELCDGLDNDCNGDGDALATCPNGSQCIEGTCAQPCQGGEFPCPGGQVCREGYCVPASCDGVTCPEGEVCSGGLCVPEQSTGGAGGAGGAGGSVASSGGSAEGGEGSGASPSSGAIPNNSWGLATGGGGLRCGFGPNASDSAHLTWVGLLAMMWMRRRKAAKTANGGQR